MKRFFRFVLPVFSVFLATTGHLVADTFQDLLKRVPEQANVLLLLDVEAIQNSALGRRENFARKHENDCLNGVTAIPPTVSKMVVASQLDPTTLHLGWKITLAEVKKPVSMSQCMRREGGTKDEVSGQEVIISPRDSYYLALEPRIVAEMGPANRQALARWLRFARKNTSLVLSDYLQEAAASAGDKAQAVMAIDLGDVLEADGIRKLVRDSRALVGKIVDREELTRELEGVRGATFTIQVDKDITGELRLDCAKPVKALAQVSKPLILEVLDRLGAHVQDIDDWRATTDPGGVILRGSLTLRGARQILCPLLAPTAMIHSQLPESPGRLETDTKARASQRYFQAVKTLLDDLKQEKTKTWSKLGYFYNQYAAKIDDLPMLNVDDELLKFGATISSTLRAISVNAGKAGMQQKVLSANAQEALVETPGYYYGAYGYNRWGAVRGYTYYRPNFAYVSNYGQITNLMAAGIADEKALRDQTWKNIDDSSAQIRRKMIAKYQVEF